MSTVMERRAVIDGDGSSHESGVREDGNDTCLQIAPERSGTANLERRGVMESWVADAPPIINLTPTIPQPTNTQTLHHVRDESRFTFLDLFPHTARTPTAVGLYNCAFSRLFQRLYKSSCSL